MRAPVAAALKAALLVATLSSLGGCGRGPADAEAPGSTPPAAADSVSSAPPLPGAKKDMPPPEGVLRAYVWDCDGGLRLRMKNLYRDNAITLELHEGPRKLPHVIAASGAKYSDGSLTFWTKGSAATFERSGSAAVNCRELRAESLVADARERGVRYRGTGNEPGWVVEIGPGSHLLYAGNYGEDRRQFDDATERDSGQAGVRVFAAGAKPDGVALTLTREPCSDDMSGESFDYRMDLEVNGKSYRGCATAID
jgi:uncharacterized membrane protein